MNKSLLSIACGIVLSGAAPLYAEVISDTIAADIIEPANTYDSTAPTVLNMSVTTVIGAGPCITDTYTGCTLADILNDINPSDDFKPEVKVHMTAGDFPDDRLISNATLRQRGASSRGSAQKSFRIKLDSKKDLWRGERRIQLIKSMYDFSRVRNKLSYDLISEIPHLPSMRSQFVQLEITNEGNNEDYGLYTSIEHFGKEYLVRRDWDKDSRVYKAEYFDFYNDAALKIDSTTGKPVNKDAFEERLEIKRGKIHLDFANMLRDLNDPSIDFNTQIMGKYFNRDNYLSWFALNILVNNADTNFHNYYLYNPKGGDNFYMVPWDYDLTFGMNLDDPSEPIEQKARWSFSHGNWWGILLHRRFLSEAGNFDLLKAAVLEVKNKYLTEAKIQAKADRYYDIVFPILTQNPDWNHIYVQGNTNPERIADFNNIFAKLSKNVDLNYARFLERANDPMPFQMEKATFLADHQIKFKWDTSESLHNQAIFYELEISSTKDFKAGTIVRTIPNLTATEHTLTWTHPKGQYYFRIRSRDRANPQLHWQEANNEDDDLKYDNHVEIYGVKKLYVSKDGGTITPPTTGFLSNSNAAINVDGNISDWSTFTPFPSDPDDITNNSSHVIDWESVTIAHNDQTAYMLYKNYGAIGNYLEWGWQAFIDTDNNPTTGFQYGDTVGADYIIEGSHLLRYTGTGNSWNWTSVGNINHKTKNNTAEFGFPRSWLGNTNAMKIAFQGANESYGGNTVDTYPNNTNKSFVYSFGNTQPSGNQAPIANDTSISLTEDTQANTKLPANDPDGDVLNVIITQPPRNGTLNTSANGLFISYKANAGYTGKDSFKFKVADTSQLESNIATVSLTVAPKSTGVGISNPVNISGLNIDGKAQDWSNLTLFNSDPNDINSDAKNPIDWDAAGMAHSNDTIYLLYKNHNKISPNSTTGNDISWGWQTFLDTDKKSNTGYKLNSGIGAEYLIEGKTVFKYNGDGSNWSWVKKGKVNLKYENKTVELSFPRSWLSQHSNINIAFYGNNEAYHGHTFDNYPNIGGFEYHFRGTTQIANRRIPIASMQKAAVSSPTSHAPKAVVTTTSSVKSTRKGGGSFTWPLLTGLLLFIIRRRLLK